MKKKQQFQRAMTLEEQTYCMDRGSMPPTMISNSYPKCLPVNGFLGYWIWIWICELGLLVKQ